MKSIIKVAILLILSFLFVYFMYHNKILDFSMLQHAFEKQKKLILFIAFLQLLNFFFMTLRYYSLIKIFEIKAQFPKVLASSFVSNGLGQWMPGALAVIELLRISLMFGISKENINLYKVTNGNNLSELALRSKLTAVSLLDRLIGFFLMTVLGALVMVYIYFFSDKILTPTEQNGILNLLLFSVGIGFLIILLFLVPKFLFFRAIFERIERRTLLFFRHGFLNKFSRKVFHEFSELLDSFALASKKLKSLWPAFLCSFVCLMLMSTGTYVAGIAVSGDLPFIAILAATSFLSLASLVPLSFGGIGWVQVVTVFVLSFFSVSPQTASSAQLLQTAINLLTGTLGALFFIRFSTKRVLNMVTRKVG